MKVVGLSGAQGGGKSSLLQKLKERGWIVDDFRVSRAVQAQLGWETLERVMDSPETMMLFQNEVLDQKYRNDAMLAAKEVTGAAPKEQIILTERTFADIYAYTALWAWRFVDSERLSFPDAVAFMTQYTHRCAQAHKEIYSATLVLPLMDHIIWENDPNRAAHKDAGTVFEDVERFLEVKLPVNHRRLKIHAKSVEDRALTVETFLEAL